MKKRSYTLAKKKIYNKRKKDIRGTQSISKLSKKKKIKLSKKKKTKNRKRKYSLRGGVKGLSPLYKASEALYLANPRKKNIIKKLKPLIPYKDLKLQLQSPKYKHDNFSTIQNYLDYRPLLNKSMQSPNTAITSSKEPKATAPYIPQLDTPIARITPAEEHKATAPYIPSSRKLSKKNTVKKDKTKTKKLPSKSIINKAKKMSNIHFKKIYNPKSYSKYGSGIDVSNNLIKISLNHDIIRNMNIDGSCMNHCIDTCIPWSTDDTKNTIILKFVKAGLINGSKEWYRMGLNMKIKAENTFGEIIGEIPFNNSNSTIYELILKNKPEYLIQSFRPSKYDIYLMGIDKKQQLDTDGRIINWAPCGLNIDQHKGIPQRDYLLIQKKLSSKGLSKKGHKEYKGENVSKKWIRKRFKNNWKIPWFKNIRNNFNKKDKRKAANSDISVYNDYQKKRGYKIF